MSSATFVGVVFHSLFNFRLFFKGKLGTWVRYHNSNPMEFDSIFLNLDTLKHSPNRITFLFSIFRFHTLLHEISSRIRSLVTAAPRGVATTCRSKVACVPL